MEYLLVVFPGWHCPVDVAFPLYLGMYGLLIGQDGEPEETLIVNPKLNWAPEAQLGYIAIYGYHRCSNL